MPYICGRLIWLRCLQITTVKSNHSHQYSCLESRQKHEGSDRSAGPLLLLFCLRRNVAGTHRVRSVRLRMWHTVTFPRALYCFVVMPVRVFMQMLACFLLCTFVSRETCACLRYIRCYLLRWCHLVRVLSLSLFLCPLLLCISCIN